MKRTKEEAARTRQAVMDGAFRVFTRKGFAQTTLEEIAAEAQVTRGAIYWHFKNKLEVFQAVLQHSYDKAKARIDPIFQSQHKPREKIRLLLRELFLVISDKEQFRIMEEVEIFKYAKKKDLTELYCNHKDNVKNIRTRIREVVVQGIEAGELNKSLDPDVTVLGILSLVSGMKSAFLSGFVDISIKENAERLADIFIHGIA